MTEITNNPKKLLAIKAEASHMIEKYATNESLPIQRVDFVKMLSYIRHISQTTISLQNKLNALLNEEIRKYE